MGCVMACFRAKDDDDDGGGGEQRRKQHPLARFLPFRNQRCLPWVKQQVSVPVRKREDTSPLCGAERLETGPIHQGKFLKDYGTVETHAKKRKGFGDTIGLVLDEDDRMSKKLPCNEQHHRLFSSQQIYEDSIFSENAGYKLTGIQGLDSSTNTLPSITLRKSVDSEEGRHDPSIEAETETGTLDPSSCQNLKQTKPLDLTPSPYPTPLKLTDEMQTPFTVYPDNKENHRARINARTRTQLVYPILNPVENLPEWKLNQSIDLSEIRCSSDIRENSTKLQQLSPALLHNESPKREGTSPGTAASFCKWMTPLRADDERRFSSKTATAMKDPHFKETPEGGGPSFQFGDAQASYNALPKLWSGNGIPNTTSKYQEDQKVTWHATPFAERLEKVLSRDKLLPQRKPVEGKPTIFEDDE